MPSQIDWGAGTYPRVRNASNAAALVQPQQYLGVRRRMEPHTLIRQGPAQLAVVVDLAVEHQGKPSIITAHRLAPAGDVDDREPTVGEGHAASRIGPKAFSIGPPMPHESRHRAQALAVHAGAVSQG